MPTQQASPVPRPRRRRQLVESRASEVPYLALDLSAPAHPLPGAQRHPALLSPDAVLRLQRAVGNRAACSLLSRRPTMSAPSAAPPPGAHLIFRWSVDSLVKDNRGLYDTLIAMMLPGRPSQQDVNDRRLLLRSLAPRTESAEKLEQLLKSGHVAKELDQALKVAGDLDKVKALSKTFPDLTPKRIVFLTGLAGDYTTLVELAPLVTPAETLINELSKSGTTNQAKNLKAAIDLAGSFAELLAFKPLSDDNFLLLKLLNSVGKARLAAFVPIAKNAITILNLLEVTDVNTLLTVMTANRKADLATLRPIVIKAKVTGGPRVDPFSIRFTQATYTNYGEGYTVQANIERLKSQPAWDIPGGAIRVFQKTREMDAWKPDDTDFGRADARYLEDDQIYTLDNRRLVAYQRAGRQIPAPQFVPTSTVKAEKWKFTTGDRGQTIRMK